MGASEHPAAERRVAEREPAAEDATCGSVSSACATKGGREASKNARECKLDQLIRAKRVLGQREHRVNGRRLRGG